jgi:dimethylargininase
MMALTHPPSPSLDRGLRTHVARVPIDFALALRQHGDYCAVLNACGAEVRTLDVNRESPDGTFIEDTAVVLNEVAVLASMGTEARRGEPAGIEPELRKYRAVFRVEPPARLEGGDVLHVGRTLLVGMSSRTDCAGAQTLQDIVRRYGYTVLPVPVRNCLHLKSACTALPDGVLLLNPSWVKRQSLRDFATVDVPEEEPWAANTLPVGGKICLRAQHMRTADLLRGRGFDVLTIPLSEFAKAEGGVTCLSLLID